MSLNVKHSVVVRMNGEIMGSKDGIPCPQGLEQAVALANKYRKRGNEFEYTEVKSVYDSPPVAMPMDHEPFDFTSSKFDTTRVKGYSVFYELDGARFILDNEEQGKYYTSECGGYAFKADHGIYSVQGGKATLCDYLQWKRG